MKNFLIQKNLALISIKCYLFWIKKFQKDVPNNSKKSILEYVEKIKIKYAVSTQRVIFTALNFFFEYKKINIKIKLPRENFIYKKFTISFEEYKLIIDNIICNNYFESIRNKAIFSTLWETGMRASELINLRWIDISDKYIKITSKNNRTRFVPYPDFLFSKWKSHADTSFVFSSIQGKKLTYAGLYKIFKKHSHISPHILRHSYATRLLKKGIPINYVSNLLGHANINTTLAYINYSIDDIYESLAQKIWQ